MARHDPARCDACLRREAAIDGVAARSGCPRDTVAWIAGAVTFVGAWQRKDATSAHVDAAELCRMLVADLPARTPREVRVQLEAMGLATSRDIGRVVYALIDAGLCTPDDRDREEHFAAIYDGATIEAYAAHVLATRPRDLPRIARNVATCVAGAAGALILAITRQPPTASIASASGAALLGIAWLLSRGRPARMRFGLPWSTLRAVRRADAHDA
ncbi:putative repeat protein (TIGR04138 family) [Dokdonella fugitiva]|uniref:Putative repeat protein (TIGR04138 family) n=1 Tax=Dokdonella fugitiva TaxID=328517 RepID=A0A839F4B6_9GAMM|nr:hypothetical protein [Dokdonella fugitiva]MBA8888649.1 putative repeat protein (TIGR04138 family) [Dokdonella fugitiva]